MQENNMDTFQMSLYVYVLQMEQNVFWRSILIKSENNDVFNSVKFNMQLVMELDLGLKL